MTQAKTWGWDEAENAHYNPKGACMAGAYELGGVR